MRNPAAPRTTALARYRTRNDVELGELIERFEADPDPLNVLTEVAIIRAVLQQALDRMEAVCPTCKRSPDEERIPALIEGLSRVVARIEKVRAQRSVSVAELVNFVNRLALVVKHHVRDPDTLEAIAKEWKSVGVSTTDTSRAR